MFNPLTTRVAEIHQEDVLKEAEEQHRALNSSASGLSLRGRVLLQLGNLLIAAGSKLHERYEAQVCADPGECQPATW